ncbi:MAG: peptidylprolyl isomerase [Acidobacteriota bacterium]
MKYRRPAPTVIVGATLVLSLLVALPSSFVEAREAAETEAEANAVETSTAEVGTEVAVFDTSHGRMVIAFHTDDAPQTVAQIKRLVRDGFYDGRIFYRVVAGHVIQTGDVDGKSAPSVPLEAGLPHIEGAVGMARGPNPSSGTTEIYICLAPRPHLDGQYAIFGHVVEGLETLRAIGAVEVDEKFLGNGVAYHSPKAPVTIERATLETRPAAQP